MNNNNDIENQNFIIDGEYLDNDETFTNESNSPLERFKTSNILYNSNFDSSNNFRKSQSYPNNYYKKNTYNIGSNSIELVEQSFNPLVNNRDETNETSESSNLIISPNTNSDIDSDIETNYFIKIYNWFGLNKISVKTEILNKFISIILHIFIMIVFEIYFYFNYVVDIEKQQFLDKIQQYIDEFSNNLNLDNTKKELVYQLFGYKYDNTLLAELYTLYINSLDKQKQLLHHLMIKSCKVAGIFGLVLLGLIGYGLFKRYKIKWKWIWVENFLMFVLLGIFEYWFFMNVILNYNPITDAEIKYYVANQIVNYFNSTI